MGFVTCIFGFLQLVLSWKPGPELGKLWVIHQGLAIWGLIITGVIAWLPGPVVKRQWSDCFQV